MKMTQKDLHTNDAKDWHDVNWDNVHWNHVMTMQKQHTSWQKLQSKFSYWSLCKVQRDAGNFYNSFIKIWREKTLALLKETRLFIVTSKFNLACYEKNFTCHANKKVVEKFQH